MSPYTTGMKIYTNLDPDKQKTLNDIMNGKTWKWKDDKVQAGIAIVDVNTGALVATGGGRNQKVKDNIITPLILQDKLDLVLNHYLIMVLHLNILTLDLHRKCMMDRIHIQAVLR